MIPYTNSTCDLDLTVQVPATLDEAKAAFGESGVLLAAIRQTFYGPWNSAFRKAFVKLLEETTGVARRPQTRNGEPILSAPKKDGTRTPVLETESKYLAFLQESGAISPEDYTRIGNEVAATIAFEIPDAERQAAPAKEFVTSAKVILAKVEAGAISARTGEPITEDSFTASFESSNAGVTLESLGGFTIEGIARALQIDDKRLKAERLGSLI
jgi:hypothetical protein